mgnify:CR=1 FL=1
MKKLIQKYGHPNAIIFSNSIDDYNIIWGFDDIFTINDKELDDIDILDELQSKINSWKKNSDNIAAVGYLSYDAKQLFYPNLNFKKSNSQIPAVWFGKPKIVKKVSRNELYDFYSKTCNINKIQELASNDIYEDKISIIKEYLKAGDVYQINFTQPMQYHYQNCSPIELFASLAKFSNPNFGSYIDLNSHQILSLSPENFFLKKNNIISSSPIKGTRTRSDEIIKDKKLLDELKKSEKDRAEHVMIVDLIRNDLGKICEFGSVNTENLFKVHSFQTIHHMISDISGKVNKNILEIDIFRALFPGGSITGAPKQRAIEIIDDIEEYSRGIYTGSMGYISNNGDMNFNIAIRTLTVNNNNITYPVGGGIVWDSIASEERKEAIYKSKVMNI